MGSPIGELQELFIEMVNAHGEEAVRRALRFSPMLTVVRDSGDFYIETASRAATTDGVPGTVVMELPRKTNQPTEISFIGGKPEFQFKT